MSMKPSYEELEEQLNRSRRLCDAALANERVWETTMMEACGEDGPASVAAEIAALRAQRDTALESLRQQLAAVVAENACLKDRAKLIIGIIANTCNDYCMCGDAMKNHVHGGCGHPTGMFDYHYNKWLESDSETPATNMYLAEVRAAEAKSIYEGILDNPAVTDMESLVDWLEQHAKDSVSFAAQLRQVAKL